MTQTPYYPPQPQYPAPAQPQYPAYPQQAQQQFAQFMPGVPAPAPQPTQPLAQGTLDDFFNQPTAGGGKSLSFKTIGQSYAGVVTRPLGAGDVQQQTDVQGRPLHFRDGRPKFVMKVPLQMQPSAEFPDGLATWFVKGQARDELVRAMAEAGAPAGAPEAGSVIQVTYVGDRSAGQGFNPAKQFAVVYQRPQGAAPVAASPAPVAQPAPAPAPVQVPVPQPAPVPQAAPAPAPAPQPTVAPQMAQGVQLDERHAALLAQLTGQPQQ